MEFSYYIIIQIIICKEILKEKNSSNFKKEYVDFLYKLYKDRCR